MRSKCVYERAFGDRQVFAGGFDEPTVAGISAAARSQNAVHRCVAIRPDIDPAAITGIDRIDAEMAARFEN